MAQQFETPQSELQPAGQVAPAAWLQLAAPIDIAWRSGLLAVALRSPR